MAAYNESAYLERSVRVIAAGPGVTEVVVVENGSTDDTPGMKALARAQVLPVVERCRFGTDLFDTELVLRAERAGLVVTEIPVTVVEQRPSRTSIVRRGVRSVAGLGRLRIALWRDP